VLEIGIVQERQRLRHRLFFPNPTVIDQESFHERNLIILDTHEDGRIAGSQKATSASDARRHQAVTTDRFQKRVRVVILDDRDHKLQCV